MEKLIKHRKTYFASLSIKIYTGYTVVNLTICCNIFDLRLFWLLPAWLPVCACYQMPRRKARTIARQNQNPQMLNAQTSSQRARATAHERKHERERQRERERGNLRVSGRAGRRASEHTTGQRTVSSCCRPAIPQAQASPNFAASDDVKCKRYSQTWISWHLTARVFARFPGSFTAAQYGSKRAQRGLSSVYRFLTWSNAKRIINKRH